MTKKSEVTSKKAATAASKVLRSKSSSKAAKSAAGSALSQRKAPKKVTLKPTHFSQQVSVNNFSYLFIS